MINEKERIIKKLGIDCLIEYSDGTSKTSKCLIKRASSLFNSMISLEAHRRGDFIYTDNVKGGCYITNTVSGEKFLSVATYPEIFKDVQLSVISHMVVVNATMTVQRIVKSGTVSGDIVNTVSNVHENVSVFLEHNKDKLRQFEVGLHPEADYAVFLPYKPVNLLDRVAITTGLGTMYFKVTFVDFVSYEGITVLHLASETRK